MSPNRKDRIERHQWYGGHRVQPGQEDERKQGKPDKVIDRIVEGKINKFLAEVCLLDQAFVKDPDRSVGALLGDVSQEAGAGIEVTGFQRFKLGEAVEG